MLFQLNPSSSMIINRARLTSAAGETRDRVNDTNARRSSLVRLKTDCMLHIVLLKSMLHNTSLYGRYEHQVVARQVGLNNRDDVDDGRLARGQSLSRNLSSAQKDGIDIQTILFEQAFFFGNPDMALGESQERITEADFF